MGELGSSRCGEVLHLSYFDDISDFIVQAGIVGIGEDKRLHVDCQVRVVLMDADADGDLSFY